jgi:hypothetical protein
MAPRPTKGNEDFDVGQGGTGAFACRQALALRARVFNRVIGIRSTLCAPRIHP